MRPVIGITSNFDPAKNSYFLLQSYIKSVEEAGGVPFIIPYVDDALCGDILDRVDGIIFTGGSDFSPSRYGGQHHPRMSEIIEPRDEFEFALIQKAISARQPTLGICRGMQIINVVLGGTIFDDTQDQRPGSIDHRTGSPLDQQVHDIEIKPSTLLHAMVGKDTLSVNSVHHQAVNRIAETLRVSAVAEDGVIEAIEHPDLDKQFLLGVQWHPEHLTECASSKALLRNFVEHCASRMGRSINPSNA